MANKKKAPEITFDPYWPVDMQGAMLAFETEVTAVNFLKRCTVEGTLRRQDGKTTAIKVLVFREDAEIEEDKE